MSNTKMLTVTINDNVVQVPEGSVILDAAKKADVFIPTLCQLRMPEFGIKCLTSSCRVCMVELEGRQGKLATACSELCTDGMVVRTNSTRALMARRTNLELILSNHPPACLTCPKNLDCELQALAASMGIRVLEYTGKRNIHPIDDSSQAIIKDPSKCIMCRRCETMCNEVQTVGVLSGLQRGFESIVAPAFHLDMGDTSCTFCGQCVAVCPTGALTEMNHAGKVWSALHNPRKHTVVQVAPAVRVAIGEMFGLKPGTVTTGKLATALRILGFDAVFDTDWGADLTVIEEAAELVHRIQHDGTLPILTSCCPAWVTFIETQFPDMLSIPSSCKSPQIMLGAMAKSYYAKKMGLHADDITVVSIMPCLAKKAEAAKPELSKDHIQNVDIVISTREFGHMLHELGVEFDQLPESEFDSLMGESTGASVIFGTTGGVIEAACRTAYYMLTGEDAEDIEFTALRGLEGIREAELQIQDKTLHIGIAHGLGNARKLLEGVRDGSYNFDAIEIMACPGGCIGGGGQPYHHGNMDIIFKRQQALYQEDRGKKIRQSHHNPMIKKIYEEYLGEPYGELAHDLLHTEYTRRERI
ncbi:MAG: NADH-dependent [FeFe] hydrogenase, group A6 [Eubacteriales bacterium]|nr:NADH-dependent [FeFe] hydrogenase, group A6 [Eubacteriales bacterium]